PPDRPRISICAPQVGRTGGVPPSTRRLRTCLSLGRLGALRERQGCEGDEAIEHVTPIFSRDEVIAPGIALLEGRLSMGPLRRRRPPHLFAVPRAVEIAFLAGPILDFPLTAVICLVEHSTWVGDEKASPHDAVRHDEMTGRRANTD